MTGVILLGMADKPDPSEWQREQYQAASLRYCPQCKRETTHEPYTAVHRNIGDNFVRWFCAECGTNNGI